MSRRVQSLQFLCCANCFAQRTALAYRWGNCLTKTFLLFWYDPQTDELFGVTKINAQDLQFDHNGLKTVSSLHRDWWKKQQMRAKAKGQLSSIYLADYTKVPRGRIFQTKDEAFQIMCGSWVNDQIVELVTDEFDLQEQSVSVVIDEHWEIGHGWSE